MSNANGRVTKVIAKLDAAWTEFQAAFAGLTAEQLQEPGVTGTWSVRDLIAHVTWWEEEALRHLPVILAGGRPPRYSVTYGGIDAFNALMFAQKRGRSLAEVRADGEDTHRRLVAFLQGVPPEHLAGDTRFRRRLRLDTYGHYPIHTRQIQAWREERSAG